MEFFITKEETKKLDALVKITQSVADTSIQKNLYILKAENNKLKSVVYGNGNIVEFTIDIEDLTNTDTKFFYIDINEFIQTIERVLLASGMDKAKVNIQMGKMTISAGKSRISKVLLDSLTDEEYNEADGAFVSKSAAKFSEIKDTLEIDDKIIEFISVISKFLAMANEKNVTGVCLEKNKIMYFDQALAIIEKRLPKNVCNERLYISKNHFDFLSKLIKIQNTISLKYSNNSDYVSLSLPIADFNAILSLPIVICEYPTDEEKKELLPPENDIFEFDTDIELFKTKISAFEGVFSSSTWRHKEMWFTVTKDTDEINLYFSNATSEVDIQLPISDLKVTSNEDIAKFKLSSLIIYDSLSKFQNIGTDKVHVICSSKGATDDDPSGMAVKFVLPEIEIITSKLDDSEII